MDYKKTYNETLEQLYLIQGELLKFQDREERLDLLFKFSLMIDQYILNFEQSEKTEKQQLFLKNLMALFNRYGEFYVSEIISRRKLFLVEKELFEARQAILLLKEENEKLKAMKEWE